MSIKVLMLSAECFPFAKVGGLGDVVGSLPPALKKLGVDVRVIMPLYGVVRRRRFGLKKIYSGLEVPSGRVLVKVNIWEGRLPGSAVKVYFIEAPAYFKFREVYVGGDNAERFLFFTLASLYALPALKFKPQILHLQDSHVALAADIVKTSNFEWLRDLKTIYTIHNFQYQGKTGPATLSTANLSVRQLKSLSVDARDGDVNFTVQGILNADMINTVSPSYAQEITTAAYGAGLERVIRRRRHDLYGILNGIDTELFDPARDRLIAQSYRANSLNRKRINKLALQKSVGLPLNENIAVVGLVSRIVQQKGLDLIGDSLARLKCQFVFLGNGEKKYEEHLLAFAGKYPENASALMKFDLKLAQQIYAGADIFLMPSRFEPCGLGQMIAMRYGTVPVVRLSGGLKDTVSSDLGFRFSKLSKTELFNCLKKALDEYYSDPREWQTRQLRCMQGDYSWKKPAQEYLRLYQNLLKNIPDKK